jgi:putative transposase
MRPYSEDLRDRFCRLMDRGMSARGAARHLEVSESVGVKWAQRRRATGTLKPGKVGGHCRPKLEPERDWLMELVGREKDLTLHAILARLAKERGVEVSCDALWRFLRAGGITFKKRRSTPRNRSDRTSPAGVSAGRRSSG